MGTKNVVLWNGRVVTVPDDQADSITSTGTAHVESASESQGVARKAHESAIHADHPGGGIDSFTDVLTSGPAALLFGKEANDQVTEGLADTVSFGGYGKLKDALSSDDTVAESRAARQAHGPARLVGSLAGIAINPGGVLGDAGLAMKGAEAIGLGANSARLVEGAALGVGGHIADSNVTGDPLTVEGTLQAAGVGSVFNLAAGAIGDKLFRGGQRAQKAVEEAKALASDVDVAQKGAALFKADSPTSAIWSEVRDTHQAAIDSIAENNKAAVRATKEANDAVAAHNKAFDKVDKAYREFIGTSATDAKGSSGAINDAIDGFEKAHKKLAADIKAGADVGVTIEPEQAAPIRGVNPNRTPYDAMSDLRRATDRAKLAVRQGDPELAASILHDASDAANGEINVKLPELPESPKTLGMTRQPEVPLPEPKELPPALAKTLKDFARQHPDTVAKLADSLDPDTQAAFTKLADNLGLTADDGVAGLHYKLKNYSWTVEDIAGKEAAQKAAERTNKLSGGISSWLLEQSKKALKYTASRASDVGGIPGAFTRTIGGEVAGKAMNTVEDAVLGSTLMEGKAGLRGAVNNTLAKYGVPAGRTARALGPVTDVLSQAFPSGKRDNEPDIRQRAANRMTDVLAAIQTGGDNLFNLFSPLAGHPADLAFKFQAALMGQLNHLAQVGPKDPGSDHTLFKSNWLPTHEDAVTFAHRIEAVIDPLKAIIRTISGEGHPAAGETLNASWPATVNEVASQMAFSTPIVQKLSRSQSVGYSHLFGTPMDSAQDPQMTLAIQAMYLPRGNNAAAGPSAGGQPGFGNSPHAVGRPPAVQNQVAGSSVSALTQ